MAELDAMLARAEALEDDGELEAAIALLDRVIAASAALSVHARAYGQRASVRDELGDAAGALADCAAGLAIDPGSVSLLYLRAIVRSGTEDWAGARTDLDAAIARAADRADMFELRGMARYNLGDYRGARDDLGRAIALDADTEARFSVIRGMAALHLEQPGEAIEDFTRALDREDHGDAADKALAQRAKAYAAIGANAAALADLVRLRRSIGPSPGLDARIAELRPAPPTERKAKKPAKTTARPKPKPTARRAKPKAKTKRRR
jgi:tetratricopeptide (TPR) repeat protein